MATLDAREDMRQACNLPITWIYGKYDNWVKAEFVRDVMSIKAEAPRDFRFPGPRPGPGGRLGTVTLSFTGSSTER